MRVLFRDAANTLIMILYCLKLISVTYREHIDVMDALIRRLREVFEEDEVDVDEVERLLAAYSSNKADWKKFAHFDPHK